MNSNNTQATIRSLIIYALCVPLAVWIGYLMAAPATKLTFGYGGILALVLLIPLLLRWHHFFLIAGWNFGMTIFFLPGSPPLWLLLTAISLGLSVLHRMVDSRAHFLSAPQLTWPLIFFFAVVMMTAKLTGGIGLHSLGGSASGSDVAGGKHYITILFGIFGYFALTAMRIPPNRVKLYVSVFFLAGFSHVIGDLAPYVPPALYFIFAFFPASGYDISAGPENLDFYARYAGLGSLGLAGFLFVLSRYGVRGIFMSGRPWRWVLLSLFFGATFFGGFRSIVILCVMTFTFQFFLERMYQTHVMPVFIFGGIIGGVLLIAFANKLPYTFQRSLAFLPLKIDQAARLNAEDSEDWRLQIWRDTYPKVPQYLLLGKGYALTPDELAIAENPNFKYLSPADLVALTGNYHSGPLSVLMPFGAWGAIALIWFWIAAVRALFDNYRYGDPAFHTINTFLLAYYIAQIVGFLFVFGAIENDLASFAMLAGLSVSINGGIRRKAMAPVVIPAQTSPPARPQLQPVYQR